MASQTNNLGTTAIIVFLFSLLIGGLYFATGDISANNDKLDLKSEQIIYNLGVNYTAKFKNPNFETENNEFNDSTFDGVDSFSRQYLEDKSEIEQKQSLIKTILLYPGFLISVFGVEDMLLLSLFSSLIYGLIAFFIGLQIYKAISGKDVD